VSYDPGREDEKLENRLLREIDRRFTNVERKVDELEKQIQALDGKIDANFKEIAKNKRENYIWLLRIVVSAIISAIVGAGAVGFIEIISKAPHP
jgi:hypothetical protein